MEVVHIHSASVAEESMQTISSIRFRHESTMSNEFDWTQILIGIWLAPVSWVFRHRKWQRRSWRWRCKRTFKDTFKDIYTWHGVCQTHAPSCYTCKMWPGLSHVSSVWVLAILIGKPDQDAANLAVSTFSNSKWDVCDNILKIFVVQLLLQGFLMGDFHCFQESDKRRTNFGILQLVYWLQHRIARTAPKLQSTFAEALLKSNLSILRATLDVVGGSGLSCPIYALSYILTLPHILQVSKEN